MLTLAAAALNVWAVSDRVDEIIRLALYKPVWLNP